MTYDDPNDLSGGLSDISLSDNTLTPTLDVPYLDQTALTNTSLPTVAPASNTNQSGGFNINQVTSALVNMFDGGVAAFNNVAKTLGTPQIGATQAVVAAPVPVLGLSQTQWIIIGGGAALVLVLLIARRR